MKIVIVESTKLNLVKEAIEAVGGRQLFGLRGRSIGCGPYCYRVYGSYALVPVTVPTGAIIIQGRTLREEEKVWIATVSPEIVLFNPVLNLAESQPEYFLKEVLLVCWNSGFQPEITIPREAQVPPGWVVRWPSLDGGAVALNGQVAENYNPPHRHCYFAGEKAGEEQRKNKVLQERSIARCAAKRAAHEKSKTVILEKQE